MKIRELKGMSLVNIADGVRLGRIEDVLIDTTALQVGSLVLKTTAGQSSVAFATVRIGPDAVTVDQHAEPAQTSEQSAESVLRSLDELDGMKVVDTEGSYLGDAGEFEISEDDGALTKLKAHRGGVLGVGGTNVEVSASAIRAIGADYITVDVPAPAN